MKRGICRLCLTETELCKQSHVIPTFMYNGMWESEKVVAVNIDRETGPDKPYFVQTADFDKDYFCQACENVILGKLDRYGAEIMPTILQEEGKNETHKVENYSYEYLKNIDYTKFKLFVLSLLWRASVSRRIFFEAVSLGPHEEIIRKMIVENKPGDMGEYPIVVRKVLGKNTVSAKTILAPNKFKYRDNILSYQFSVTGIYFSIFVVSKDFKIPDFIINMALKPTGLVLMHINGDKEMDTIVKHWGLR